MSAYTIPRKSVAVTPSDTLFITDQERTPVNESAIQATSFTTPTITLAAHGYTEGDTLLCTNAGTSLLTPAVIYYCKYVSANTFQVALTLGGAAVALGSTTTTAPTFQRLSILVAAKQTSGSLLCGGGGVVIALPQGHLDTNDPTPCNAGAQSYTVQSGQILVGHFKKVFATGTTATLIICQHGI